ncbi:SDR family oxidoreductase [Bradyrhizobium sp. U87765 SZCCT0131]|uniref:SDR family NAD(P)-dependent oxidoreductase n=1 Tax=unclassified Bradyrhizobium TaxID=2631580 RepID=UPI001BA77CAF|nr:SDR family oxidoreductase [Bradyrhizobium sp. U87765 SZCCT0131]MBR1262979.1 SDR family oxidoreductase [Bradyrhizobium sp. U87765 SZCCT0134]MBR1307139.1 SDR family oxidoreductase [Bradyrhizobium sp. U87765 SZCCT0110]MBR1322974.1 SDR family oxidoreductase [Bradyrhizobium sp. U87765 SZCCT0109]MBR1346093.1 SDR family oxidoreductase [Bradyrhizobium sp. U87765 SZCCT0048]
MDGTERRAAVVTGGSGGIGAAICRALAAAGLRLAVLDRHHAPVESLVSQLPGRGHLALAADISREQDVRDAFDQAQAALGEIAVLVTAAGVLMLQPDGSRHLVADTPTSEWQTTQDVNATGTFLCCREFASRLPQRLDGGRIVTLSSVAAQLGGYRSSAAYIASKSAVLGFTKVLARELAPRAVTVNAVAPGLIDAPMLRLSLDPADDANAAAQIPLGRLGTPDDVAAAVRFLVSADASYITGATIDVNGGYRMQ